MEYFTLKEAHDIQHATPCFPCPCGNTLWAITYHFKNRRVSIKCINCRFHLTRELFEHVSKKEPLGGTLDLDLDRDLDLSDDLDKTIGRMLRSPEAIEAEFSTRLDALYFLFREALAGGKR